MSKSNNVLNFLKKQPNNITAAIILHDAEEKEFPAKMPVLRMSLVGDQILFTICKEEDKDGSFVYTRVQEMAFDLETFLRALDVIIDDDLV